MHVSVHDEAVETHGVLLRMCDLVLNKSHVVSKIESAVRAQFLMICRICLWVGVDLRPESFFKTMSRASS